MACDGTHARHFLPVKACTLLLDVGIKKIDLHV